MGIFDSFFGLDPYQADASGKIQAPQGAGFFGNLYSGLQNNSDALMGFGMGMLSGRDMQDGWRNAAVGMQGGTDTDQRRQLLAAKAVKDAQQRKAYADFVAQNPTMSKYADVMAADPELGQRIIANEATRNPLDEEYRRAQIEELRARAAGKNAIFGLNPIYGQRKMPDGSVKTVLLQPGNNGEIRESALPDGVEITSGVDKVDGGTVWYLYDKRTGQLVGTQPKNVGEEAAQKAAGTAEGTAVGTAKAGLGQAEDAASRILDVIDDVRKSEPTGFSIGGLGGWSYFNGIRGTAGNDFQRKVDQIRSGAFLEAFQQLKGAGAITEQEGGKATDAITRLGTDLSPPEFRKALNELENIVRIGIQRQRKKAAGDTTSPIQSPAAPEGAAPSGNRIRMDENGNPL